jgi:hypothetical protein
MGGGVKERILRGEEEIYIYEDSIMKCPKLRKEEKGKGEWKYNGEDELVQGILYAYVKLSQ